MVETERSLVQPPAAAAPGAVALRCTGLRKRYGSRLAVDGVSFAVAEGECYGLLGPNGAGKTTTISMVCALLSPDEGTVEVLGRPAAKAKAQIGYVPQDLALYPELSAADNLRFFGRLYGLAGDHLARRLQAVLEVVGLADRAGDTVGSYSGGMKRRINIAAGLLHEPRLLVLDEPTVGVDPQSRNAILETVAELGRSGMAVLYTTHYMEEAARLCDRVGIIDAGRLVAEGTRRDLVDRHGGPDRVRVSATGDLGALGRAVSGALGAGAATVLDGCVEVTTGGGRHQLPALVAAAGSVPGVEVTSVEVIEPDLEAVFLALTGKELRD